MYPKRVEFINTLERLRRSKNTVIAYDMDLNNFFSKFSEMNQENIQKFVLESNLSPISIARALSSFKVYCQLFDITINFKLISKPRLAVREKDCITEQIFINGIEKLSEDGRDINIRRLFRTLYNTGMRVNELLTIGTPRILNGDLMIIGKGNKERRIPLIPSVLDDLSDSSFIEFLSTVKYSTMLSWTKKYFGKEFSPHSFRHGYATRIINNGANPYAVQKVLGHSSYNTTLRYFHMQNDEVREVIKDALKEECNA